MSVLLSLLAAGCAPEDGAVPFHFDGPVAAAVLPMDAGPWAVPTGYVANGRNGTIIPLDLKMGRLLTDDPMASFLRSSALPTGHSRLLADVAVVAGADASVTVWAIDNAFTQLLRVPYVYSVDADGFPVEVAATATDPVFIETDASGDSAALSGLLVRTGFTTTESWSIEYDGTTWWAKGARSGTMLKHPTPGEAWRSDNGEIEFTLTGTATVGDRFEFTTDTGVVELDPGGRPTAILAHEGRIYASVTSTPGQIVVYDGVSGERVGAVELPEGAQPSRLSGAPDGRLFVADGALANVWLLRFDQGLDPAIVAVESIPTAGPVVDVAWQGGFDREDRAFENLFVATLGALRVDVWNLTAGAWLDPNPATPEVDGVFLGSPVSGLGASVGDVELLDETNWGARPSVPTVAVSTGDGFVYQLEGSTGCGVLDTRGPHGPNYAYDGASLYATLDDQGAASDATLWVDDDTGEQIVPSDCGGVTRTETWTIAYDSATLSWEVEGTLSGVQANRAYADERYLSDTGALSFFVAPGALPPTDGDRFVIAIESGLLVFGGSDEDEDGTPEIPWNFPGRPVGFEAVGGPSGGGWDPVDVRQYMVQPIVGSDFAVRLELSSGQTDVSWK